LTVDLLIASQVVQRLLDLYPRLREISTAPELPDGQQ